jgi:hypothetical protein
MAKEFQARRGASRSDTALKVDIGSKYRLRRRAAIDAVDRGLLRIGQPEINRAGTGEPHDASGLYSQVAAMAVPLQGEPKQAENDQERLMAECRTKNLSILMTDQLRAALAYAAEQRFTTPSEYTRQSLIEKMRSDGIEPTRIQQTDAREKILAESQGIER